MEHFEGNDDDESEYDDYEIDLDDIELVYDDLLPKSYLRYNSSLGVVIKHIREFDFNSKMCCDQNIRNELLYDFSEGIGFWLKNSNASFNEKCGVLEYAILHHDDYHLTDELLSSYGDYIDEARMLQLLNFNADGLLIHILENETSDELFFDNSANIISEAIMDHYYMKFDNGILNENIASVLNFIGEIDKTSGRLKDYVNETLNTKKNDLLYFNMNFVSDYLSYRNFDSMPNDKKNYCKYVLGFSWDLMPQILADTYLSFKCNLSMAKPDDDPIILDLIDAKCFYKNNRDDDFFLNSKS